MRGVVGSFTNFRLNAFDLSEVGQILGKYPAIFSEAMIFSSGASTHTLC
jgi:hypothetical protein